jgi:hypothetical protein
LVILVLEFKEPRVWRGEEGGGRREEGLGGREGMASEIEIVGEGGTPRESGEVSSSGGGGGGGGGGGRPEEGQKRDDVFTAAAYGDVDKLRKLVEERGCSVLEPDSGGYFALQWCALNNRTAAAQYLLEVDSVGNFFGTLVLAHLGKFISSVHLVAR